MIYRYFINIYGKVQGVGFRPYVYNEAIKSNLRGWVSNNGSSLIIDIEGEKTSIKKFLLNIIKTPPPLAQIVKVRIKKENYINYKDFTIKASLNNYEDMKYLLADIGICKECLEDISNKNSKWYNYPFTSCTNCGPRYTIYNSLPYDRENTVMKRFEFCSSCNKDYSDFKNRRFHAQTLCCDHCGPELVLIDKDGTKVEGENILQIVSNLIFQGKIVAIKGIGGFHLCCDGFNEEAIRNLRLRKERPYKPLALMMKDVEVVKEYVKINEVEENLLKSKEKPIVLLERKESSYSFSNAIAPGMKYFGVMLPYTPLHYLIFSYGLKALVMTSGNISGSTVEYQNQKAFNSLKYIADYFLIHDREINIPIDDSVTKVIFDKVLVSRIGRGYAPYYLDIKINNKVLAMGSEMKNTFAVGKDNTAFISQYCGDIKEYEVYEEYIKSINYIKKLLDFEPNYIIVDKHPAFVQRTFECFKNIKIIEIQHHYAHMVSCITEHKIDEKVIGVIYDGLGYGDDGNIWGGEFFVGDKRAYKRLAQFKYVKIQGGDKAIRDIYKIALSFIDNLKDSILKEYALKNIKRHLENENKSVEEANYLIYNHNVALENNLNCFKTSSVGRIFDAVASILGVRQFISYDGQGAIELETKVVEGCEESYSYNIEEDSNGLIIDIIPTIEELVQDKFYGESIAIMATKFHNTLIEATLEIIEKIKETTGISKIVLSGGVFENRYLISKLYKKMSSIGFEVFFNEKIPINDGGISVGQLVAGNELIGG